MKFSCTQFAWLAFTPRSSSRASASARNADASSAVGGVDADLSRIAFRVSFFGACDAAGIANTSVDATAPTQTQKPIADNVRVAAPLNDCRLMPQLPAASPPQLRAESPALALSAPHSHRSASQNAPNTAPSPAPTTRVCRESRPTPP